MDEFLSKLGEHGPVAVLALSALAVVWRAYLKKDEALQASNDKHAGFVEGLLEKALEGGDE